LDTISSPIAATTEPPTTRTREPWCDCIVWTLPLPTLTSDALALALLGAPAAKPLAESSALPLAAYWARAWICSSR
jgi:hypothetical protein